MARIPLRLAGPTALSAAPATIATVPAGEKYIVRHIHLDNPPGTQRAVTISIGADGVTTRIFDQLSVPVGPYDHFGYYTLEAGEVLQAFADVGAYVTCVVSGDDVKLG